MSQPPVLPSLAADFPSASRDQWLALTQKVLKGGDFNKRLVARTADGLELQPIYARPTTIAATALRHGSGEPWGVASRIDHPDAGIANPLALADLDGGADHVTLVFAGSAGARGFGLASASSNALDTCLKGVLLDLVHVRLEPGADASAAARAMAALVAHRQHEPGSLSISFGLDPVGQLARNGSLPFTWAETGQQLTATIAELQSSGFKGPFIAVDLRPYHEAGASDDLPQKRRQ